VSGDDDKNRNQNVGEDRMSRRSSVAVVAAIVVFAVPVLAQPRAQNYPDRTVTLVVAIAPGGGIDAIARVFADKLRGRLGQSVVVENRVGAGGVIGADYVAKSAPDGYTLLLTTTSEALVKWLRRTVPFDVVHDFAPIGELAQAPLLFLVNPSLPVSTVGEFINFAKANPGKLSYGTPGVGTPHQLVGEMLKQAAGIDVLHVPYRGSGPSLSGLLANQVPAIFATSVAVMPFIEAGKVRVLATAGDKRAPILPDVPTLAESGFPQVDVTTWFGVAAPAGTPAPIVERLNRELKAVAELPDVRQSLGAQGFTVAVSSPDEFRRAIASRHDRFGRIIADVGLKAE
jgi:tripartite-type tricarboxylate transporter receptor subunit TctC